jgi:hypothetical protein
MIFGLQYFLLLIIFIPELPVYIILGGVACIFLMKTIIPSVLGALGIREVSGMLYFGVFGIEPEMIILPSLMIWFFNVVIPSIAGIPFLWNYQLKLAGWR